MHNYRPAEHHDECSCAACQCGEQHNHQDGDLHAHDTFDPTYGLPQLRTAEEFVTSNGRWTDGGGYTSVLGGSGGTISWSLAGAGLQNVTGQNFFTGESVALSTFISYDFAATLQRAFDEWSAYADINFVQVADGGGNIGAGGNPTIRVVGGYIDGQDGPNVLARAFYPTPHVAGGDIVFDSGNTNFYSNEHYFFLTALHEIGHAIGLGHESTSNAVAIMNPSINTSLSGLQADDIAGAQAIYGAAQSGSPDLIASNVAVSDTTVSSGETITVTYDITNSGDGTAADTTAGIYLSTDAVITVDDIQVATELSESSNAIGAVDSESVLIEIPNLASGNYYVGVIADVSSDERGESSESNNASASPVRITIDGVSDDYGESSVSAGSVNVGGAVPGEIDFSGDRDWFAVWLQAGREYIISLDGSSVGAGTLSDPFFHGIYNGKGELLSNTTDDDGGGSMNSQLSFTPTASETFFLSAGAYASNQGTYTLSVTASPNITGTAGKDTLNGDERDNVLFGMGGQDFLYGYEGDDTLDVGAGDGTFQYARGHSGNDTYIYAKEQGLLFIDPRFEGANDGTADRVMFTDLNYDDITFGFFDYGGAIGNSVRLRWDDGVDSGELRIGQEGQYIEEFIFADQTTLTWHEMMNAVSSGTSGSDVLQGDARDNIMNGLGGQDFLYGYEGDDTLNVGAGDGSFQYARGYSGNDTYIYAKEQGLLFIDPRFEGANDGVADRVVFTDLNYDDLTFGLFDYGGAIGNSIRLQWNDGSNFGELRIGQEGQFIEAFEFADGSVLSYDQLMNPQTTGTSGQDMLEGDVRDNIIFGLGGQDFLYGFGGDDTLDVGAGDGKFQYARGYDGNDTYIYSKEQGLLFIDPRFEGAADGVADKVVFTDLDRDDLSIAFFDYGGAIGNSVRLHWNDGTDSGELRIGQEGQHIETFQFANGLSLTWDEMLIA